MAGILTHEQKQLAFRLRARGWRLVDIARGIGRVPSVVTREVAANGGREGYSAWAAHQRARQAARRPKPCKLRAGRLLEWSSLKRELIHRYVFPNRAAARRAIFAWINRYNTRRRHSSLGYITPVDWENQYRQPQADLAA